MTNYSAFHWSEKSRKHAESSSSKADESKQWAIGEPTEPDGGSAKYWAHQSAQGQIQSDWTQTDDTEKDFIKNKPTIINTTSSTSTTDILSANMGKELQDQITNLKARGRYLSVWNSTTGLAMTTPVSPLPYDYSAGDYFIVGTVGATNYKPNGSQYTGTASTTVETGTVNVNDTYYYDGSSWSLLSGGGQVTATFSGLGGSPYDNSNLSTALNGKQQTLESGTNIKTINGSTILGSGDISTSELPSQSGQSGKYLTTNGSTTSWTTVNALPSQSGQSGKFLTTNGTSASWAEVNVKQKTFNILDFKWSDHELNDQNWLNSSTFSWQSGTVYSEAYNHLVADLVGATASIETVGSYSITVYTATDGHKIVLDDMESTVANIFNESGVAWYYIVDTTNTRFKLPRSTYNKYSKNQILPVKGNGKGLVFTNGTQEIGMFLGTNGNMYNSFRAVGANLGEPTGSNVGVSNDQRTSGITTDSTKSGIEAIYNSVADTNMKLYFYVGEFSQSATEQTAGLNAEMFNGKVDVSSLTECHTVIETYQNGTEWYRLYDDGWVEQGGIAPVGSTSVNLITEMLNTNYTIIAHLKSPSSTRHTIVDVIDTASFSIKEGQYGVTATALTTPAYWEVKGFVAQ